MKVDGVTGGLTGSSYLPQKVAVDAKFAEELEAATQKAAVEKEDAKLKAACKDFEAMFLNLMYSKMRETVPDNSLYGTSHGEKIMQSMLDTELTKKMANAGGVGLAAMMYKQLSMESKYKE